MCDAVGKRLARLIMKAMKPLPVRRDPVEALPEEVLSLVWRLLDLKDLLSACLVSRQWHASLSSDNVWKRYTDSRQTEDHKKRRPAKRDEAKTCSRSWKNKFLSQRSLLHNWSKNRYHTCIKTPITGDVTATSDLLCVWKESSVVLMSPINTTITNHMKLKDRIECVQTGADTDLLLVTTESGTAHLYRSSREDDRPLLTLDLDQYETQMKLTSKYICRLRMNKLLLYDLGDDEFRCNEIQVPECKKINTYNVLNTCLLIRSEPLDYNYEAIYSLYDLDTGQWSIVSKISTTQLGSREHFEYFHNDYYLLVNYLLVDDTYMYSNACIYNKMKPVCREIISNSRRKYFCANFSQNMGLFTVADYRLLAVDLSSLKNREIYVAADFHKLNVVLDRFFMLTYRDKLEIWDLKFWKRLYCIRIGAKDKIVVRDQFVAISSLPCSSLPTSLKILNFTEPELSESPSASTFDLSNIFI